jgi:hypothetical protein
LLAQSVARRPPWATAASSASARSRRPRRA